MLRFLIRWFIAYPYSYFYVYRRALKFKIDNYLYDRKLKKIKQAELDKKIDENMDRIKKNRQKTIQRPNYQSLQVAAQYSSLQSQAAFQAALCQRQSIDRQSRMYQTADNALFQALSRQMQERQLNIITRKDKRW